MTATVCASGFDPNIWFDRDTAVLAKQLCLTCPLYWSCAEYAIEEGIPDGIWGGLDARDRQRIWKKRGGKPTAFLDSIDAAIGPLLQYRRDYERSDYESDGAA